MNTQETKRTRQGVRDLNQPGSNRRANCQCRRDPSTPTRVEPRIRTVTVKDLAGEIILQEPRPVGVHLCVLCGIERYSTMMTDPALFSDAPKRYPQRSHRWMAHLFDAVFARYPEARFFDPCPCGIAMVVIPEACIMPWHYPIYDAELRDRVRECLRGTPYSDYAGDDAVLVLAEMA